MVGELVPAPVDPQSAGRDFWTRFHALRRVRHAELRPDDPLEPDSHVETQMKREDPFEFQHTYEIQRDGAMLSWFHARTVRPESPEYDTNKHLFWADAYVLPEHRRQGLARLWLPVVAQLMDEHTNTVVGYDTDQESGHGYLRWLGASPKLVGIESRLRLSEVDWPMLERWSEEGAKRSPETKLEIYDGGVPEEQWADFAPQFSTLFNDIPLDDLDLGEIVFSPEMLREYAERRKLAGEVAYSVLSREPDGVISGVTETLWAPYRPKLLAQEFTGVRPDARGRGIGKWIKAAMLLHMREIYPELAWVVTDNARSNGPMLKINRTMGFKPYYEQTEYQMTRAELESRIRSL